MTLLLLGVSAVLLAQEPDVFFRDPQGSLTLRGFVKKSLSYIPGQEARFSGTGTPLIVDLRSSGLLLQGETVEGTAKPQGKAFYLQEAKLSGSAVAIMDTKSREDYELSQKTRSAASPEQSRTRVDSSSLQYRGSESEGILTVPGKLRVRSDTNGSRALKKEEKSVSQTYTQALDLTGAGGTIALDPQAKTTATNLKRGTIEGPVDFNFKRIEKDEETNETTLVGKGDHLTFDFTGAERTLILSGNVHLVGTGSFNGETNVEKLIIVVDEKLQPIRYETEGKPATTRLKTGGVR